MRRFLAREYLSTTLSRRALAAILYAQVYSKGMPQTQAGSLYAAKIGHLSPAAFDIFGAVHQKLFTIFKAVPDRSRLFKLRRIKILPPPISASSQNWGAAQQAAR